MAAAQELARGQKNSTTSGGTSPNSAVPAPVAKEISPGHAEDARVEKQEPNFYWLTVSQTDTEKGVVITCRSPAKSKFKLILFDSDGGVRQIIESVNRKKCTFADMFFVPFDTARMSEFIPLKFYAEDKETPIQFHLLDTLETASSQRLTPGRHLLCVYGDNWFQDVKYTLSVVRSVTEAPAVHIITTTESILTKKKSEMTTFQEEFTEARKRYELMSI